MGKSTWLKNTFAKQNVLWFDLLEAKTELELKRDPDLIIKKWKAIHPRPKTIIIDEIQKNPNLLDVVHKAIEDYKIQFILTGSSAKKLKRGASNLLAGRAFEFFLLPFSCFELNKNFQLHSALQFGLLPKIYSTELKVIKEKERYLYSYVSTYLKEEILIEQIVRKLDPFQKFLEAAAQANGKIINYAKIGRDAGIDSKQVERYFPILTDTWIGFFLEPYHHSIRKRQSQKAKFYFFDTGVPRALTQRVAIPVTPGTYEFGDLFEHFIILEFYKLNLSLEKRFKLSYFRSEENIEIDLIIEIPSNQTILIEIKSTEKINTDEVKKLAHLKKDFRNPKMYYLSLDKNEMEELGVTCLYWKNGIQQIMGL